jgi:hypothetical protein
LAPLVNALERPVFALFARIHISDDNIELLFPNKANGALAGGNPLDGVTIGLKCMLVPAGQFVIIIDNQDRRSRSGGRARNARGISTC